MLNTDANIHADKDEHLHCLFGCFCLESVVFVESGLPAHVVPVKTLTHKSIKKFKNPVYEEKNGPMTCSRCPTLDLNHQAAQKILCLNIIL